MGWLREFMSQAGLRSFGELAREALAHPEWPEDTKAQTRSLEAILGRLDRLEDVDWLTDRPGVQQVLASTLKVSVAEIRTILLGSVVTRPFPTRLRLDDVRVARSFSPLDEPLPPSIPERVALPATWARCCWVGAHGAGFGLTAQWLAARGLAQTASVEVLEDVARLPVAGPPLYLRLEPELLEPFVTEWRGSQPLCIAVDSAWPLLADGRLCHDLELLQSTPIAECLDQVFDWVFSRATGKTEKTRKPLFEWLRRVPLAWGVLETLGDALGLVGACLEGSIDPTKALTKDALLRQWMEYRTEDLARERHRDITALRRTLPDVLIDMAQAVLLDETRPLQAARTIDDWLNLVPEQHRRGPDIDWLTTRLVTENLPMRKPDLERAAQRLPPGAHRIVVALRELHVLRPISVTRFAVRPHFLGRLAHVIAKDRVAASSPLFWGEALLRPFARRALLPPLTARAESQPEALAEDALDHVDLDNPALVCALETTFVLVGLSALSGVDIGEQLAASLLVEQAALTLTDVGPVPCARTAPLLERALCDLPGAFFLAAWALSEHPVQLRQSLLFELDPWHSTSPPGNWSNVLDCIADTFRAALQASPPWLLGAIRLLDRLRHTVGPHSGLDQRPHPIFLVGSLLDAVELGVLEWSQVQELLPECWQLDLLMVSIKVRNTPVPQMARTILSAWADAGHPVTGTILFSRWSPALFNDVSAELLARCMMQPNAPISPDALASLPLPVWQAWVEVRRNVTLDQEPAAPWNHAPASAVEQAIKDRPPTRDDVRAIVWRRFVDIGLRQVDRIRTVAPQTAADWLHLLPATLATTVAKHAQRYNWLRASDTLTKELARLMYDAVARRVQDWQVAYECLNQIELERRRFAQKH